MSETENEPGRKGADAYSYLSVLSPAVEVVDFKSTSSPPISYALETPIPNKQASVLPTEASTVCVIKGRRRGREGREGGGRRRRGGGGKGGREEGGEGGEGEMREEKEGEGGERGRKQEGGEGGKGREVKDAEMEEGGE